MTREEAINEIKSWAIPSEKGREVLETLIPELAESEDEKTRKFLIQHISEWIGCIEHDLKISSKDIESEKELAMFKAALAYLEKQKETSHISEMCKENANSFIDGIIEVRSFQRGMEEGRKLEKQKEQKPVECIEYKFDTEFENQVSHLIASVLNKEYEYSVEYVKYVAQSLLGYAKNELKQKLPLMGGDTDTYFDDLRMTTKPLTSREWFDEGIKYAQRLQKEQKHSYCLYGGYPSVGRCRWCSAACSARLADVHTSEEKEYVRTIKSIISDFIRDKKPENLAYYQRIYDWLDGRHVPFSCGHENGEPADPVFSKQEYESYPIISEDTTSAKPRERSLEDDHIIGFVYDLLNEIEWKDDWAMSKEECLRLLSNYSPQKPTGATINDQPIPTENHSVDIPLAEWSEEDEKTYTFVCNYFETCWWSKTWDISREQVLKMLKSLHSQSKQEWKEEDEEMRDTCIDLLEHFPRPCGEVIGQWKDCISWLKSLRPQPKQEWSEEDEKDVAHIIRVLDDCYAYGKHDLSKTDHENLVGTLKSLCLQPKLEWSEEDEHRRDEIIQWLREYQAKFNLKYDSLSIDSIESLIDWLKSLRPSKNKM